MARVPVARDLCRMVFTGWPRIAAALKNATQQAATVKRTVQLATRPIVRAVPGRAVIQSLLRCMKRIKFARTMSARSIPARMVRTVGRMFTTVFCKNIVRGLPPLVMGLSFGMIIIVWMTAAHWKRAAPETQTVSLTALNAIPHGVIQGSAAIPRRKRYTTQIRFVKAAWQARHIAVRALIAAAMLKCDFRRSIAEVPVPVATVK